MLHWRGAHLAINDNKVLTIPELAIGKGELWTFVGGNGSGKTALAKELCHELPLCSGIRQGHARALRLSFEQQQQLAEKEWQMRNTDMVAEGEELGFTAEQLLFEESADHATGLALARQLGIAPLLSRPYRYLSSGEGRKLLLAKALLQQPELLVLDEPFDGLDQLSRHELMQLLATLHHQGQSIVLIVNRFEELPEFATHIGLLSSCNLIIAGSRNQILSSPEINQLIKVEEQKAWQLPPAPAPIRQEPEAPSPLVIMRNVTVRYDEKIILDRLSWSVSAGEHWQISGPNGAGKSTLLSLVTGDHPQGYCNDLTLFGRRRGSGESIWEIKQQIGYVTPALHLDYRVATTPLQVILSGYFDSIGLYTQPGDQLVALAYRWLELVGLKEEANTPFHSLSFGQQRLLLIARALVKHPRLLILDEPLQGLDPLNRHLVRKVVSLLLKQEITQLLFVSHHPEDAPEGLTHRLEFVPDGAGGYRYEQHRLYSLA
jgi:ABC-type molybdenum transport system, ATPase component/photorepair protein PhrA